MAPNTWRAYHTAWRSFRSFVLEASLPFFPLQPAVVELYVVVLARRVRYSTIKAYLTALKIFNTIYGFDSEGCFSDQLHYILRGIRRSQTESLPTRPHRIPMTPAHLRLLFQFVTEAFSPTDALCYRAAFSLAFFGLLRVSKFTCPTSHTFDPRIHLSLHDI